MSAPELQRILKSGAARYGLALDLHQLDQLSHYLVHLERWNRKINLTSLPLAGYPAATLERLIFEPLQSRAIFPAGRFRWLDFGSGGGSPAIPLRIVLPDALLTMIESRSRKVAFLRDVVRALDLAQAEVVWHRIRGEDDPIAPQSADIVTVRALRLDAKVAQAIHHVVKETGQVLLFGPVDWTELAPQFSATRPGLDAGDVTVLHRRHAP